MRYCGTEELSRFESRTEGFLKNPAVVARRNFFVACRRFELYYNHTLVPYRAGTKACRASKTCGWLVTGQFIFLGVKMPAVLQFSSVPPSPLFVVDFTTYSSHRSHIEVSVVDRFRSHSAEVWRLPINVLALLYECSNYSARVSEMLSIKSADILEDFRFLVRGKKRSRSYLATFPVIKINNPSYEYYPFFDNIWGLTYKSVYNWCCRIDLGCAFKRNKTVARTHAHRYQLATEIAKKSSQVAAGDILHHRSKKSIEFYIK